MIRVVAHQAFEAAHHAQGGLFSPVVGHDLYADRRPGEPALAVPGGAGDEVQADGASLSSSYRTRVVGTTPAGWPVS